MESDLKTGSFFMAYDLFEARNTTFIMGMVLDHVSQYFVIIASFSIVRIQLMNSSHGSHTQVMKTK
jgi:hypothetical protein